MIHVFSAVNNLLIDVDSSDDVNKAFRKLSVLLHPDKSNAPGSEEAFKILVATRSSLLKLINR